MGASLAALASHAFAQAPVSQAEVEEVVVTGSRIVRDGFQAPTPVTTLAADDLAAKAPTNIPDALNQLPQFRGSASNSRSVTWNTNSPNQGNYLNLRNLGTTRALILLDGVRVPPTSFAGGVDINTLPQALVQRVDVVTGGASAAYGSDAVVGVVNFVLDKAFTGVKANVQAGTSRYADGNSYKVSLAGGTPFMDGRGHIEGSVEAFKQEPVHTFARENGSKYIMRAGRSVNGVQYTHTYEGVRFSNITHGGYILSGPLAGFEFLPGGAVQRMPVGQDISNSAYRLGGGGAYWYNHTLISGVTTRQAFGRVSYDVTENVNAHFQAAVSESRNTINTRVDERLPASTTIMTIFRDNPFLQPGVVSQLGATQSFTMSRISYDTPQNWGSALNNSQNYNFGLDGEFEAGGRSWNWDANYVYGINHLRQRVNEFNNKRFYAALDAARDSSGNIVCRANVVAPGSMPGCVALNYFGVGAPSQAAIDYITWYSQYRAVNEMNILAANISGDIYDLPAGPISIAFGGEVRNQKLDLTSNTDPALAPSVSYANIRGVPNGVLISDFTNIGVAAGSVDVKEAYVEVAVPVLKDMAYAQSLDLNAAIRATDYSTSGRVETWKVGFSYVPFQDLRFRGTVSRDIAAPSLYQLFQGSTVVANLGVDIHTGATVSRITETRGNPDLRPEVGSMVVAGAVYSPSWLPGFTASVDGYSLYITDAIASSNAGTLNEECEASNGTGPSCAFIIRPFPFSDRSAANSWTRVIQTNLNQSKVFQSGFDLEGSYRFPLDIFGPSLSGQMQLRGLASIVTANRSKQGPTVATANNLGVGTNPRISGSIEAQYTTGPVSVRLSNRWTGKTQRSLTNIDENYAISPNVSYTDLNVAYKIKTHELFFNVQNLLDTQPPIVADPANPGLQFPTNRAKYDVMGRYYTVGVRLRM